MDLVKKNLVSVICGVVALLAIVALFYPIGGYYEELQREADARKSVDASLKSLLTTPRKKPIISLDATEAPPLDHFPTNAVIEKWEKVTEEVKAESAKMFEAAVELNRHKTLVPDVLPESNTGLQTAFRDMYKVLMDMNAENKQNTLAFKKLQGGMPATQAQLNARLAEVRARVTQNTPMNAQGVPFNPQLFQEQLRAAAAAAPEELGREIAQSIKVYIDQAAMSPHQPLMTLAVGRAPDPAQIFVAQMGLWIQEDVLDALAAANSKATNVMDAPVKHLLKIAFRDPTFRQLTQPPMGGANAPAAPNADPAAPLPVNFANSPTGRQANGMYDVFHYNLKINADAEQVPAILQELSRNRFVTVMSVNQQSVDTGSMQARQFYYGNKPVVQLDLQCEQLFLRKWTEPMMPPVVKQALGIPVAAPAAQ